MQKLLKAICLGVCLSLASASFAATATNKKPELDYLYVQVSPKAVLKEIDSKNNVYELTLMNTSEYLEYFSDRPERIAGVMKIETFLGEWKKSFEKTPPNVSINGLEKKELRREPFNKVVELSNPVYDANKKTMTYTLKLLPGETLSSKEIKFHGIALFIDDYCASCVASGF